MGVCCVVVERGAKNNVVLFGKRLKKAITLLPLDPFLLLSSLPLCARDLSPISSPLIVASLLRETRFPYPNRKGRLMQYQLVQQFTAMMVQLPTHFLMRKIGGIGAFSCHYLSQREQVSRAFV